MRGRWAAIFGGVLALAAGWTAPVLADGLPVTPQKLVLAQQVVDAAKLPRSMTFAMNVAIRPFIQQINAGEGSPEFKAYTVDLLQSELGEMQAKVTPLLAQIYAGTFDERQLTDILAFYHSPTGQLLIDKQPELARAGQLAILPLIPAMQRELIDKLFDHMCAVQKCTPAQREKLASVKTQVLQKLTPQTAAPVEMPAH